MPLDRLNYLHRMELNWSYKLHTNKQNYSDLPLHFNHNTCCIAWCRDANIQWCSDNKFRLQFKIQWQPLELRCRYLIWHTSFNMKISLEKALWTVSVSKQEGGGLSQKVV